MSGDDFDKVNQAQQDAAEEAYHNLSPELKSIVDWLYRLNREVEELKSLASTLVAAIARYSDTSQR